MTSSVSNAPEMSSTSIEIPAATQLTIWIAGLVVCLPGLMGRFLPWDSGLAAIQISILLLAPIAWIVKKQRPVIAINERSGHSDDRYAWPLAFAAGSTSLGICYFVGAGMVEMPPYIHDEYSYQFQAKTLLSGAFSVASHPTHPELFNQMHVLNEGRMASRYYPGTGLWLAPFVLVGHPYWGHWIASAISSMFVFWTGYELGKLRVAIISGFAFALSPGVALFGNMLLAHQPTLVGLSLFLWSFSKWHRTNSLSAAFIAGCGLSFAMICRPATAAGFGFPFGLSFLISILSMGRGSDKPQSSKIRQNLVAIGLPLFIGWSVMLAYHKDVTGSWTTSPYQLYTDIYTPRHVYGFNNVVRGEKRLGPKVIEAYDRWADNLTPKLATENVTHRLFSSWLWTFDLLPQILSLLIILGQIKHLDRRWFLIGFAIITLHAIHVPYWVAGILGWHYVFETAPLWCLLLGLGTDLLFRQWQKSGQWLMPVCWSMLLAVSFMGNFFSGEFEQFRLWKSPRVKIGQDYMRSPREKYGEFNQWLGEQKLIQPALLLIETDSDEVQIDYVVNTPHLNDPILRGRYRPGITDLRLLANDFPDRRIYVCNPNTRHVAIFDASSIAGEQAQ